MKNVFHFNKKVFIYLPLLFLLIFACKTLPEVPIYGDLSGTIKDSKTSNTIEGATVSITPGNLSTITLTDGKFSFKRLDPNNYKIEVKKDRYLTTAKSISVVAGENVFGDIQIDQKKASLDISPIAIDFTGVEASKVIYLKNGDGAGSISYTAKPNENWISMTPTSGTVTNNQTITITITVDRKGLAYGNYTGSIVFNADNNSIIYNVSMQNPNPNSPSVTTNDPVNITQTSAEIIGNLTNIGGGSVIQRGHCWSESPNPTITDNRTSLGAGLVGNFSSSITGLIQGKTYFVRAFATNNAGTGYSETKTFTTSNTPTAPAVSNGVVSEIGPTAAKITGNLTNTGGSNVTQHGHCWSTSIMPTISNDKTTFGSTNIVQTITSNLTNLKQGTKYYVRAFATNAIGTNYSNEVAFETTVPVTPPTITTGAVSNVGQTSATVNATVSNLGSSPIVQHGFCYSTTNALPSIDDKKVVKGTLNSTGSFNTNLSLSKGTNYYVRPFVQTQAGIAYYGVVSDFATSEGGLSVYLPFNSNPNDETSNNNNARANNGAKLTTDRFGNSDRAYDLNGGYIDFSNPNVGFLSAEISYCFWIKLESSNFSGNAKIIFGQTGSSCSDFEGIWGFTLFVDPKKNNKVNISLIPYNNSPYQTNVIEQSSIVGDWHHIVIVKKDKIFSFFIDGILTKSLNSPYSDLGTRSDNFYPLRFGNSNCSNPTTILGKIDDIRIYTYSLTDTEVENIYKR